MNKFDFEHFKLKLASDIDSNQNSNSQSQSHNLLLFNYLSDLLSLLTNDYSDNEEKINDSQNTTINIDRSFLVVQLNKLIDFYISCLSSKPSASNNQSSINIIPHLSSNINNLFGRIYILCFTKIQNNNTLIFDTTNKLITNLINLDKKFVNFSNTSSPPATACNQLCLLIITILQQLFNNFGYNLPSLAPILIQYCYKVLKNIFSSTSTKFITSSSNNSMNQISLLLLLILKNYNGVLDESTSNKIIKIIKPIMKLLNISNPLISSANSNASANKDSKDVKDPNDITLFDTTSMFRNSNNCIGINIPIIAIANCFEILSLLVFNSFQLSIKRLKIVAPPAVANATLKKKNFLNNHLIKDYNHYFIMGLSSNHQQIRIATANGLARLLQKYFSVICKSDTIPLAPSDSITDLSDILSYYSQLYLLLDDPVSRHSIIISLIQFTSLNEVHYSSSSNKNFLLENFREYLKFFEYLLVNNFIILQDATPKLQQQMIYFFDQFYFKSLGQYNKLIILNKLLDHEAFCTSSCSIIKTCSLLKIITCLIINLGPTTSLVSSSVSETAENDRTSSTMLQSTLLKLLVNPKFEIRVNSAFAIALYCKFNPSKTQKLLNYCLSEIQNIFRNDNTSAIITKKDSSNDNTNSNFFKVHGFATAISYIIKNINKDYVPEDTIARILTFASSQLKATSTTTASVITNSTTSPSSTDGNITTIGSATTTASTSNNELKKMRFYKKKISLILLSGIMNYDESFLKIHISQFFIFWKNSLTHNYQSFESGAAATSTKNSSSSIDEVIENLEIRSCALTCLLTFLKNVQITPEISKQATYLLTKSQAYSTSISSFKNVKLNENTWFKIHEKRIMQCHLILLYHHKQNNRHSFFTNSSNSSSIWIVALNNFSDHQVFNNARISEFNIALKDKDKDKDKELKILKSQRFIPENSPTDDFNSIDDLALIHDDLCFGLSTKFSKLFVSSSRDQDYTMMNNNNNKNRSQSGELDNDSMIEKDSGFTGFSIKNNYVDAAYLTIHQNSEIEIASSINDWISEMENKILYDPFFKDILNDYLWPIYNGDQLTGAQRITSYFDIEQPCSVSTSIIDLGIDIFVNSFQYLSPIIQLSLMEKMRGAIMIKSIDSKNKTTKLREKAIAINCSIAINAILKDIEISNSIFSSTISSVGNNFNKNKNGSIFNILGENSDLKFKLLDEPVLITMIDSLKHLTLKDRPLLRLNSESIAAISSMLPIASSTNSSTSSINATSANIEERVDVYITDIVNNMTPFTRAADAMIISSMYKKSHREMSQMLATISTNTPNTSGVNGINGGGASFSKILEVLLTLIDDPHPVVHYYSMVALLNLLECHISISTQLGASILQRLYKFMFASDSYSANCDSTLYANFHLKLNSNLTVMKIVKVLVMSLGPNLQELKLQDRNILKTLIVSFIFTNNANATYYSISLSILQNITMFDKDMISLFAYVSILDTLLITNLKLYGIGSLVTSTNNIPFFESVEDIATSEIFPYTTSKSLFETTIESYFELIKVHKVNEVLTARSKRLLWICVECHNDQAPSSKIKLQTLIKYWMLESADLKWFILLNNLYKIHRTSLLADLNSYYHKILSKHDKVQVKVELEDEEVESIVNRADETDNDIGTKSNSNGKSGTNSITISSKNSTSSTVAKISDSGNDEEPTSSAFKLFILRLINLLIQSISKNKSDKQYAKLYLQLQARIQDLVKIAFSACTSPVESLVSTGVQILSSIIIAFHDAKDPYSSDKLLSQQQAQITAALTPAFNYSTNSRFDSKLASEAINVLAKFVGYGIVTPLENNGRILNVLTKSLEEFSSDSNNDSSAAILVGNDSKYVTARSRNRMKLAILNAWAELKISSASSSIASNPNNKALSNLVAKYLDILVPMWILALREYSSLKYNKTYVSGFDSEDLRMYESIWINCVDVIGCIIEENETLVYELLEKDDIGNFFFVLFAQCIEMLIKPTNICEFDDYDDDTVPAGNGFSNKSGVSVNNSFRVMAALNKLLSSKISSDIIFQDNVFAETIDLFDRLVIVSDDYSKPVIIDIISRLFLNYFNNLKNHNMVAEKFTSNIDKLFELLRVIVISIIDIIPFVDDNYNSNGISFKEKLLDDQQLLILKKSFNALVSMIEKFPKVMKVDLFSCILYIISQIYLHDDSDEIVIKNRNMIIPAIIPYLKTIILDLYGEGHIPLVDYFYKLIRQTFKKHDTVSNLTIMVLITSSLSNSGKALTSSNISIDDEDIKLLIFNLSDSLLVKEELPVAISSIKSLILFSTHINPPTRTSVTIIKELIPAICKLLIQDKLEDPRLVIEMLVLYSKQYPTDSKKLINIFTIVIPIICWFDSKLGSDYNSGQMKQYLHQKLLNLLNLNVESFKVVISEVLTADQKRSAELLVKFDLNTFNTSSASGSTSINSPQQHIELKTFGKTN